MADTAQDNGTITLPPPKPLISNELLSKALNDIVIPMAVKEIKSAAGITTQEKHNTKSAFGRTMMSIKDTWQGIWWTIPALILSLGLIAIFLKVLSKWFGGLTICTFTKNTCP